MYIMYIMFKLLIAYLSLYTSYCFVPTNVKRSVDSFKYVGDIEPLNNFDPLGISGYCSENELKYLRESEIQHGRVAMMSFVGLFALDKLQDIPSMDYLSSKDLIEQSPFWLIIGLYEFARLKVGWKNPFEDKDNIYKLLEGYQPGNVLDVNTNLYNDDIYNKELSNGRLAMLATVAYLLQSYS